MIRATTGAVLVAVVLLAATTADAEDRIFLRNGSVLTGTILKETESELVIDIPNLGKVHVSRGQILRVEGKAAPPDTPEPPVVPDPDVPEDPVVEDPMVVEFGKLKAGESVLVLMHAKARGSCRHSGKRFVAKIEVVSSKRLKLLTKPDAGALGFVWVRRDQVSRVIRLDGHPGRRLLLIDGMESGGWIRGRLADGTAFEGRLDGLSSETAIFISEFADGEMKQRSISLQDIREAESLSRGRALTLHLRTMQIGEPVVVEVANRDALIEGRWAGETPVAFQIEVFKGSEVEPHIETLLRYAPIQSVETLPQALRPALQGSKQDSHLTLTTVALRDGALRRRSVTGRIVLATTKSITLDTPEGVEDFAVEDVRDVSRPAENMVPALLARLDESGSDTVLPVLPGMSREDAQKVLGEHHPGIDVVFEADRVTKVYCSPPLEGPVLGLELGVEFRKATLHSDLVFDTRVEPVEGPEPRICTLLSRTLNGMLVRLFVTQEDKILAIEISAL